MTRTPEISGGPCDIFLDIVIFYAWRGSLLGRLNGVNRDSPDGG